MPTIYIATCTSPPSDGRPARMADSSEAKIRTRIADYPETEWTIARCQPGADVQTLCFLAEGNMLVAVSTKDVEVTAAGRVREAK